MRAGDLRERVTIQTPVYATSTQSGQGEPSWKHLTEVFASVTPVDGTETLEADSITSRVTYKVGIRWFPGITPKMRVVRPIYDGLPSHAQTLEIHAVVAGAAIRDDMTLLCGVAE
jgi:SPP1 family predicted phage head-tail adaptor